MDWKALLQFSLAEGSFTEFVGLFPLTRLSFPFKTKYAVISRERHGSLNLLYLTAFLKIPLKHGAAKETNGGTPLRFLLRGSEHSS